MQQVFEVLCPVTEVESVENTLYCSVWASFVLEVTLSFLNVNGCFL